MGASSRRRRVCFNPAFGLSAILTSEQSASFLCAASFNPAFGLSAILTLSENLLKHGTKEFQSRIRAKRHSDSIVFEEYHPWSGFNPAFGLSAILTPLRLAAD